MLRRQAPEAARFTDQQPHRWPGVLQSCDDGTGTVNLSLGSMTKADEAVKMAAANRVGDQIAGCALTSSGNCVKRRRMIWLRSAQFQQPVRLGVIVASP